MKINLLFLFVSTVFFFIPSCALNSGNVPEKIFIKWEGNREVYAYREKKFDSREHLAEKINKKGEYLLFFELKVTEEMKDEYQRSFREVGIKIVRTEAITNNPDNGQGLEKTAADADFEFLDGLH